MCPVPLCLLLALAAEPESRPADSVFVSDQPHRILYSQQGWGQLGLNVRSHQPHEKGAALQIGDRRYEKGLGHHAAGEIVVELGGAMARFESDIGLQPLPGCTGSVAFKVFVDDEQKFDSGVVRGDAPARHISVPVEGAMELRLVATDGGDGITCDCANWADARLVPSHAPIAAAPAQLDAGPFGRPMISDPSRKDGGRSTRIQEYPAEDVFLEWPLEAGAGDLAVNTRDGARAVGLNWLERRILRTIWIVFDGPRPQRDEMQAECWVGQSLWQGGWKPLAGEWRETTDGWELVIDWTKTPAANGGTRKIRWILPKSETGWRVREGGLHAGSATPLSGAELRFELREPAAGSGVSVDIHNGRFTGTDHPLSVKWDGSRPLAVGVAYTSPRPWRGDRTVLRFRIGERSFSVAVDDVMKEGGICVRDAGLLVSRGDVNRDLAGYLATNQDKKTVLGRVREMPDQTLAQAFERVHNPKQNGQPMLLSLACDNRKFVVHRDGRIQFASQPDVADLFRVNQLQYDAQMTPRFGSGKDQTITRRLEKGWLPAPTTTISQDGIVYRQCSMVLPFDGGRHTPPAWLSNQPLGVVLFDIENTTSTPAPVKVELAFLSDVTKKVPAQIELVPEHRAAVTNGSRLLASMDLTSATKHLKSGRITATAADGTYRVAGELAAADSIRFAMLLPAWALEPSKHALINAGSDTLEVLEAYWREVMGPAMQVELPDRLLTNAIRASQVHCLLAARNEDHGQRIAPWIASFTYGPLESESNSIVRGMDYWGHHDFSERGLDFFINKYSPSGMLTTGYTLMGTGWHLWSLGEHCRLTQDQEWLRANADKVAKVCEWVVAQRAKTQRKGGERDPERGLIPPGVMADWYSYAYYFCLNGYYYKGLLEAAQALKGIGDARADAFLKEAASLREDILRAYHGTQAQMPVYPLKDGTSVLGYPSQLTAPGPTNNFFPGEDANRSWCYDVELGAHQLVPQGVLEAKSREVGDMMDHMEDVQFLADGWFDYAAERNEKDWFNLGGFAKVQPYYCRNIEIYALRDDVKPFIRSYFNTIPSLLGLETLSFQEHFAGVAAWNKTHETGYFLHYSRLMLVQERGDELWLAPFVTDQWLVDGKSIKVKNAPTYFGPVSYELSSHVADGRIETVVTWPTRAKPKSIALRARHPEGKAIKNVVVAVANGKKAVFHIDKGDPNVVHLEETEPVARVTLGY